MDSLPIEIIQEIFLVTDPYALGPAASTNRAWAATLRRSMFIWRAHYLHLFDDPTPARALRLLCDEPDLYDWRTELQRRLRAQTFIGDILLLKRKPDEHSDFYRCLIDIAETATPGRDAESKNIEWLRRVYDKDVVIHNVFWEPTPEELQLRSKIHTFLGCTLLDLLSEKRLQSRRFVYDLGNYTAETMYGPYLSVPPSEDGGSRRVQPASIAVNGAGNNASDDEDDAFSYDIRANWTHMQKVHHVFTMNYLDRLETGTATFNPSSTSEDHKSRPLTIHHVRADTAPPNTPGVGYGHDQDWAGVEGRWRCSFAFCDHRDLLKYNAHLRNKDADPRLESEDPFLRPDFTEALRAIRIELHVLALGRTSRSHPYPTRPPIHFQGRLVFSFGPEEYLGEPMIVGTVSMTADGEIRWRFTSGENGNIMWSSEGVQVGGVRSAYGVLGVWTTVFHDESDPVGPFWMQKETGRKADSKSATIL